MAGPKKIVIVDDHPLYLEGLKSIINADPEFEITAEAGTAQECLSAINELRPDIITVDVRLPDRNGISLVREIRKKYPNIRMIVVSMIDKVDCMRDAFQAGAAGYVTKESAGEELLSALRSVSTGDFFLEGPVAPDQLEKALGSPMCESVASDRRYDKLSPREQQIMLMLVEGMSNKDIADQLFISRKTVENHRAHIFEKLEMSNTVELVRYAAKLGLIDLAG